MTTTPSGISAVEGACVATSGVVAGLEVEAGASFWLTNPLMSSPFCPIMARSVSTGAVPPSSIPICSSPGV